MVSHNGSGRRLTGISAGESPYGAPRRNRTGDPILTMEPPETAVRNAVSAGRVRPSGSKSSVLLRPSYAFTFVMVFVTEASHPRPAVAERSHVPPSIDHWPLALVDGVGRKSKGVVEPQRDGR